MIIEAARLAGRNLFAPETRSAFWKILGITLVMLVGLWAALRGLFVAYALPYVDALVPGIPEWAGWLGFIFGIIALILFRAMLALDRAEKRGRAFEERLE